MIHAFIKGFQIWMTTTFATNALDIAYNWPVAQDASIRGLSRAMVLGLGWFVIIPTIVVEFYRAPTIYDKNSCEILYPSNTFVQGSRMYVFDKYFRVATFNNLSHCSNNDDLPDFKRIWSK